MANIRIGTGSPATISVGTGEAQQIRTGRGKPQHIRIGSSGEKQTVGIRSGDPVTVCLGGGIPIPCDNYEDLRNKPKINGVELIGDVEMTDVLSEDVDGLIPALGNLEIESIFQSVFGATEG